MDFIRDVFINNAGEEPFQILEWLDNGMEPFNDDCNNDRDGDPFRCNPEMIDFRAGVIEISGTPSPTRGCMGVWGGSIPSVFHTWLIYNTGIYISLLYILSLYMPLIYTRPTLAWFLLRAVNPFNNTPQYVPPIRPGMTRYDTPYTHYNAPPWHDTGMTHITPYPEQPRALQRPGIIFNIPQNKAWHG